MEHGVEINFDLEKTPLQIQTDTPPGGDGYVALVLNGGPREAIFFNFKSIPQFYLHQCFWNNLDFPIPIPTETIKMWEIQKMPGPRIVILCNGLKVLDFTLSEETCSLSEWRSFWDVDIEKISFLERDLEVSRYYRPAPGNVTLRKIRCDVTILLLKTVLTSCFVGNQT